MTSYYRETRKRQVLKVFWYAGHVWNMLWTREAVHAMLYTELNIFHHKKYLNDDIIFKQAIKNWDPDQLFE